MKKSIFSVFLALVLAVSSLASCTKKADETDNTQTPDETEQTGAVVDPENRLSGEYSPNIPEADAKKFEGKTF